MADGLKTGPGIPICEINFEFSKIQEFNLHPEQELRFEVEKGCWLKLEVVGTEGNAELFGTELIKNKPYYFNDGQGEFEIFGLKFPIIFLFRIWSIYVGWM